MNSNLKNFFPSKRIVTSTNYIFIQLIKVFFRPGYKLFRNFRIKDVIYEKNS